MSKTTQIRIVSSVIAILLIIIAHHFWQTNGLVLICSLCMFVVIKEFANLVYVDDFLRRSFYVIGTIVFASILFAPQQSESIFLCLTLILLTLVLGRTAGPLAPLKSLLMLEGQSALGMIYCVLLPAYCVKILTLSSGISWFITFLIITFSGDVGAYFVGRKIGKRKLLESISPKKTVEGSFGGLLCSIIGGAIAGYLFNLPLTFIVPLALLTGTLSQVGDLFESLIKRVADVKDSGQIMPGHGGLMDRLDGLYFAAPFFYFFVSGYLEMTTL